MLEQFPGREVSIHAPAKGRHLLGGNTGMVHEFQSTPPRRGDPGQGQRGHRRERFNPRPREGATPWPISRLRWASCFNPRPREGATHGHAGRQHPDMVSIHAPAKGRLSGSDKLLAVPLFQSTPPRRGDCDLQHPWWHRDVSIHAPAKGRRNHNGGHADRGGFNPRPREGATDGAVSRVRYASVSIHAPAKGRRLHRR